MSMNKKKFLEIIKTPVLLKSFTAWQKSYYLRKCSDQVIKIEFSIGRTGRTGIKGKASEIFKDKYANKRFLIHKDSRTALLRMLMDSIKSRKRRVRGQFFHWIKNNVRLSKAEYLALQLNLGRHLSRYEIPDSIIVDGLQPMKKKRLEKARK